jgi:site-specific DNA recombinase
VCHEGLVIGRGKAYKGRSKTIYGCKAAHITRDQEQLEHFIAKLVIARMSKRTSAS